MGLYIKFFNSGVTSVVQVHTTKPVSYQESVITNTEAVDTKQTKKRKAVTAANNPNTPVDYATPQPPNTVSTYFRIWEMTVKLIET